MGARRDGAEGRLASLPQERALRVVGRDPHGAGTVLAPDASHCLALVLDTSREAVELDEQHGRRVARIAGADEVFDRARDLGVHHLERGGHDPRRDDPAHRRGGVRRSR